MHPFLSILHTVQKQLMHKILSNQEWNETDVKCAKQKIWWWSKNKSQENYEKYDVTSFFVYQFKFKFK